MPRSLPLVASLLVLGLVRASPAEVSEKNWALGVKAWQSSTALGGEAARAVDGNMDGDWNHGSVTHTNDEQEPYWEIDLGAGHYIDEIRIWNRTDCCDDRLRNFVVLWVNNQIGFIHRDIASLITENTTPDSATGVFMRPVFLAGDADPRGGGRRARTTIRLDGSQCAEPGSPGCRIRFLRIQLAGRGTLSLAEVEVIERANIPGPAALSTSTTWHSTGITTPGGAVALADSGEHLLFYYQGADGLLHGSYNLDDGPAIAGSPTLGGEGPEAALVPDTTRVFVAARTADGQVAVVDGDRSAEPLTPTAWTMLGRSAMTPAIANGCQRTVVAWLDGRRMLAAWKGTAKGGIRPWSAPAVITRTAGSAPSLAVNRWGTVGLAYLGPGGSIEFATLPCPSGGPVPTWQGPTRLTGSAIGGRVSAAAYGPHFMVATLGGDERGYFAIQHAAGPVEEWQRFEPIPASWRGDPGMPLAEPPRLFVMSGAIVAVARDKAEQALRAWIKLPNRLAPGDPWMGGRTVGGGGRSATSAAMTSLGRGQLWGMWEAPSELYLAAVGAGDRRVRAINLGRYLAEDVFQHDLPLDITGLMNVSPQADRELDPSMAPNYLEQMLTLLALPAAAHQVVIQSGCGSLPIATRLMLDRNYGSGQFSTRFCPWAVKEGTSRYSAKDLYHEWLHMDAKARDLTGAQGFGSTFRFSKSSDDPEDSGMRSCSQASDCGGDFCERAGDDHGRGDPSTKDFDPAEKELRRWDDTFVCVSRGGPDGRRPQGGLRWYDVGTADHAFIHMALAYRWYGDDLRGWVQQDLSHGNDQLQRRYVWIRDRYFGGVEYNGRMTSGDAAPGSDRSRGVYGMPGQ